MIENEIAYKTKSASEENIYVHLKECNSGFLPALDTRVNIKAYAQKIFQKAMTFEAWHTDILIGLIAAYFESNKAFITNVSVSDNFKGKGIAAELMNKCIGHAKNNHFREVKLEVGKTNKAAIALYEKFNFERGEMKGDSLIMQLKL